MVFCSTTMQSKKMVYVCLVPELQEIVCNIDSVLAVNHD